MKQLLLLFLFSFTSIFAQETYTVGTTEYYIGEYYTTGHPKVKRSEANKLAFLKSKGYTETPEGYEIDHIVPLSEGGSDDPSNMQLLTVEEHKKKTASERTRLAQNNNYRTTRTTTPTYTSTSSSTTTPTYTTTSTSRTSSSTSSSTTTPSSSTSSSRTIYTGPRGGQYYINSNGNKTYIKKN